MRGKPESSAHATRRASVLLALFSSACGQAECLALPGAAPIAITVTITSGVGGASVPEAFVVAPGYTSAMPCAGSPGPGCVITGGPGTYELDIGAPGYQTTRRSVAVTGSSPRCGCETSDTRHIDVALVPTM